MYGHENCAIASLRKSEMRYWCAALPVEYAYKSVRVDGAIMASNIFHSFYLDTDSAISLHASTALSNVHLP